MAAIQNSEHPYQQPYGEHLTTKEPKGQAQHYLHLNQIWELANPLWLLNSPPKFLPEVHPLLVFTLPHLQVLAFQLHSLLTVRTIF